MKFVKKRRRVLVPHVNSGSHVDFIGFILCFMSVLLLSCGLLLISISAWSMARKAPYYDLLSVRIDVPYFALPAGIVSCSSFWIAASLHNNRENYRFLCLLILLLTLSVMMIVTGVSMGMMRYSPRESLGSTLSSMNWDDVNKTLQESFAKYDDIHTYESAWNKIQHQLRCCGLNSKYDWIAHSGVLPNSCCSGGKACGIIEAFPEGCLKLIKHDLIWQRSFLAIHCYMVATIEGIIVIVAGNVYYWRRIKD